MTIERSRQTTTQGVGELIPRIAAAVFAVSFVVWDAPDETAAAVAAFVNI